MSVDINYSIIIPHKDIPDLLQRCVRSIPYRTDVQVIIVDDNSILNPIDDEIRKSIVYGRNVEIIFTTENKGAGYARNIGLSFAKGKWILFADADDFFSSKAFDILDLYLNINADMVLFKSESVNSETLKPSDRNKATNKAIDFFLAGKYSKKNVALRFYVPWSRMINRDYIIKNNFKFDEIIVSNDVMFATKLACHTEKIEIESHSIYCNTFRENSLWTSRKNLDIRIDTHIRRNMYLIANGYKDDLIPPIICIHKWCRNSFKDYIKCLYIAMSQKVLFQGFCIYLKRKIKY